MTAPSSDATDRLAPPERRRPAGIMPNRAHQPPDSLSRFTRPNYGLSVVEFDDQGRCYDHRQIDALQAALDRLRDRDAVVLVFVHGWKHDGRSDDENLARFREVLRRAAEEEGPDGAPVLGVFAAWRGLSLYGFGLDNLTFWDRKQAGLRVSMGAPRELFGRLRHYRLSRLSDGGAPLLVIAGHSFGGMIVYSALAQSLIEAAATQSGALVPSFADLVLLVNPAFEAVRYLPIHDLVRSRAEGSFAANQHPVFVSVTARNDWATGIAFPLGMAVTRIQESTRGPEERQALIHTMGHIDWMLTHELALAQGPAQGDGIRDFGGARLTRIRFAALNPFWTVSATPDVIDGHDGIWKPAFLDFVQGLVSAHAQAARAMRSSGLRPVQVSVPLTPAQRDAMGRMGREGGVTLQARLEQAVRDVLDRPDG